MMVEKYTEYQDRERHELLGIQYDAYLIGGIVNYNNLNAETLNTLMDKGYVSKDERQKYSPTADQFYNFMKNNEGFTAYGYLVVNTRKDRRISIEGLEYRGNNFEKALKSFDNWIAELCANDDEIHYPDEHRENKEENYIMCYWGEENYIQNWWD